ncbi:2-amino-4-hydroxy-6-hydroxymethyldihydropteridine diphosphokinase, partial [Staphylococcus hominis]|uniref:2-amino-4-hydroxy-6- hydroxymethyldihydropteridine diphosphokinase n=1 Tax=Staphylococcus hominis TaxID=1290 RepID=UPI0028D8D36F
MHLIPNINAINLTKQSSIYQTPPIPYTHQPNFFNFSLHIQTQFSPHQFLNHSLHIQQQLHPLTQIRSAPTTLHIDILL